MTADFWNIQITIDFLKTIRSQISQFFHKLYLYKNSWGDLITLVPIPSL